MMWSREIVDEVLSLDWVSSSTSAELLSILWVPRAAQGGALEIEREIMSPEVVDDSLLQIGRSKNDPLDGPQSGPESPGEEGALYGTGAGSRGVQPHAPIDESETRRRVADAIAALPLREKYVVTFCHALHLTLHEVGHVIGVADSAVAIVYARAVLRLRSRLPDLVGLGENVRRPTSREPPVFCQACGADKFCHVLVGGPPYRLTLCGQRCSPSVMYSHQVGECPHGFPLCRTCEWFGDSERPYGRR